jgi:hypothetical protein
MNLADQGEPRPDDAGFLFNLIMSFWLTPTIAMASRLKLPDLVAEHPIEAEEAALATGTDAQALTRLLNALASAGIFERLADGRFGPTGRSELLRSNHPSALGHLIDIGMAGENLAAWTSLEDSLRQGKCAFDLQHGINWIDYLDQRPDRRAQFASAMTATTRATEQAVLTDYDFGDFDTAVDVGGSHASLVGGLLQKHQQARGIVFDLPETVAAGKAMWAGAPFASRLEAVGGDFFQSVPSGDLYLLKLILHDWDDAQAIAILKSIRKAALPDARVAIIETILPADGSPHMGWGLDIVMMVTTGGRERTADQLKALLEQAGFDFLSLTPTRSMYSVMEARPRQE